MTRHYGSAGIAARVLAALREAQGPDAPVTVDALAPLDQFHGRGPLATQELVALLQPQAGERLLDIGSGIGGPARWIAAKFDCHVTGVDLTPEFCEAAEALNRDRFGRPGPHHQWQRAGAAGAGRRLRRGLFAERHHEHRRQAPVLPRGVPRVAAGRPAGAVEFVRRAGRRALFPGAVGDDGRDRVFSRRRRKCRRTWRRPASRSSISATRPRPSPRRSAVTASGWSRARCRVSLPTSSTANGPARCSATRCAASRRGARHRRGAGQETAIARRTGGRRNAQNATTPHRYDTIDSVNAMPVAAGQVEDGAGAPGADRRPEAAADRDDAEDCAELRPGKQIGGLGGDRRAARTPGQPEEQACSHSSRCWSGLVISSANTAPTIENP